MHIILVYIGIMFGIFLEGELFLVSSVIAAHHGYLDLGIVIATAMVATFIADCFYFTIGRKKGRKLLVKSKKIEAKAAVITQKIEKYPRLVFFIYRFVYGLKAITPIVIGTGKTRVRIFLMYSVITISIWTTFYSIIGYMFGELIKSKLNYIEHIEKYIIGVLVLTGIVLIIVHSLKNRRNSLQEVQ